MTVYNFMPDEWYPVATLFANDPNDKTEWDTQIDVPEELLEEGRRIQRELNAWQEKIVALLPPREDEGPREAAEFFLVLD